MINNNTLCIAQLLVLFVISHALICYENDKNGKVFEVNNKLWNYCVLVPSIEGEGRVFGVDPSADLTDTYDYAFGTSDGIYKVLAVCLLEKYDFGLLNPNRMKHSFGAEFMFRCVCNYDRCNSETNFTTYLNAIKNANDDNRVSLNGFSIH